MKGKARVCNFTYKLQDLMYKKGIETYIELEAKAKLDGKISQFLAKGRLSKQDLIKICKCLDVPEGYFNQYLNEITYYTLNELGNGVGDWQNKGQTVGEAFKEFGVSIEELKKNFPDSIELMLDETQKEEIKEAKASAEKESQKIKEEIRKQKNREKYSKYYQEHKDDILKKMKDKRKAEKTKENRKEYNKKYYEQNRDRIRKQQNDRNRRLREENIAKQEMEKHEKQIDTLKKVLIEDKNNDVALVLESIPKDVPNQKKGFFARIFGRK